MVDIDKDLDKGFVFYEHTGMNSLRRFWMVLCFLVYILTFLTILIALIMGDAATGVFLFNPVFLMSVFVLTTILAVVILRDNDKQQRAFRSTQKKAHRQWLAAAYGLELDDYDHNLLFNGGSVVCDTDSGRVRYSTKYAELTDSFLLFSEPEATRVNAKRSAPAPSIPEAETVASTPEVVEVIAVSEPVTVLSPEVPEETPAEVVVVSEDEPLAEEVPEIVGVDTVVEEVTPAPVKKTPVPRKPRAKKAVEGTDVTPVTSKSTPRVRPQKASVADSVVDSTTEETPIKKAPVPRKPRVKKQVAPEETIVIDGPVGSGDTRKIVEQIKAAIETPDAGSTVVEKKVSDSSAAPKKPTAPRKPRAKTPTVPEEKMSSTETASTPETPKKTPALRKPRAPRTPAVKNADPEESSEKQNGEYRVTESQPVSNGIQEANVQFQPSPRPASSRIKPPTKKAATPRKPRVKKVAEAPIVKDDLTTEGLDEK